MDGVGELEIMDDGRKTVEKDGGERRRRKATEKGDGERPHL
jgi:hypothetical protein